MKKLAGLFLVLLIVVGTRFEAFGYGDTFSCSYGKKPACLDPNDKVCSWLSKCVSQDAVCFDSNTCNYKGFICKSKFDEVVEAYRALQAEYEDIQSKYEELQYEHDQLLRERIQEQTEHTELLEEQTRLLNELTDCINNQ